MEADAAKKMEEQTNEGGQEEANAAAAEGEGEAAKKSRFSDEDRSKRVYVGNLAWGTSWQDLKDHMKSTGLDVAHATVLSTPDGRSKGCGIVEFVTAEDAQQAVATLSNTELNGRQIFVREDREERNRPGYGGGPRQVPTTTSNAGAATPGAATPAASPADTASQSRRVYVGNLSWDVHWQDLKDYMRTAGEVVHAEVMTEPSGRSKGCGIVEYAKAEEAQEAIRTLTDTELSGRMIFVREDREGSGGPVGGGGGPRPSNNTSVYVWNLTPETSWQDLKDHMRKAGNVDSAIILTNNEGASLGCGVVSYQRPQEAARAIRELQNSELNGQVMYVREDRSPGGGRGGGRGGYGGRGRGGGRGGRGTGGPPIEEGTQLFVGNLSFDTTWKELKDHFRQCGEVRRAEVRTTPSGQSKGFGTVQFFNKKDAEEAINRLNGSDLQGRELEVRLDQKTR